MSLQAAPRLEPPVFLRAIDNVSLRDDGSYSGDCPICREGMYVVAAGGQWSLRCSAECSSDELHRWLKLVDTRVDRDWDDRAWICLMLAKTPETWAALLAGEPVNHAELDQFWLRRFKRMGVV